MFEHRPVPKPKSRRLKPTTKMRGRITPDVYQTAVDRAQGRCERCGKIGYLEAAHLIRRWKIEGSTTANDIAMLCGPVVNTGTCHNFVDYTAAGKEWAEKYRDTLYGHSEKFREIPGNTKNEWESEGMEDDG